MREFLSDIAAGVTVGTFVEAVVALFCIGVVYVAVCATFGG